MVRWEWGAVRLERDHGPRLLALLAEVWRGLEKDLAEARARIEKRITRQRYPQARSLLREVMAEFGAFPPARGLLEVRTELAALECAGWLEQAKKDWKVGDAASAKKSLGRILKYYDHTSWAEQARALLAKIEDQG